MIILVLCESSASFLVSDDEGCIGNYKWRFSGPGGLSKYTAWRAIHPPRGSVRGFCLLEEVFPHHSLQTKLYWTGNPSTESVCQLTLMLCIWSKYNMCDSDQLCGNKSAHSTAVQEVNEEGSAFRCFVRVLEKITKVTCSLDTAPSSDLSCCLSRTWLWLWRVEWWSLSEFIISDFVWWSNSSNDSVSTCRDRERTHHKHTSSDRCWLLLMDKTTVNELTVMNIFYTPTELYHTYQAFIHTFIVNRANSLYLIMLQINNNTFSIRPWLQHHLARVSNPRDPIWRGLFKPELPEWRWLVVIVLGSPRFNLK